MKTLISLSFLVIGFTAFSQSGNAKILEQRAKDFHNAISKNNKDVWRNFMNENFTTALIERPMRAQVATSENDGASTNTTSSETKIEAKLSMFQQLHDDFGKSKLTSLKISGNTVEMLLDADTGMKGVFILEGEANAPWKIDKMSIKVEAEN